MADKEHLEILKKGVEEWNKWREENPEIRPNLSDGDFCGALLLYANLNSVDLSGANLSGAYLSFAKLSNAILSGAKLVGAKIIEADLSGTNLISANLDGAAICCANLSNANLSNASLRGADLSKAILNTVDLSGADLSRANLKGAKLSNMNLSGAILSEAIFFQKDLDGIQLTEKQLSETIIAPERSESSLGMDYNSIVVRYQSESKGMYARIKEEIKALRYKAMYHINVSRIGRIYRLEDRERLALSVDENICVKDLMALFGAITELHELTGSTPPRIERINIGHKLHEPSMFDAGRNI